VSRGEEARHDGRLNGGEILDRVDLAAPWRERIDRLRRKEQVFLAGEA
jgi:hypothetical protein